MDRKRALVLKFERERSVGRQRIREFSWKQEDTKKRGEWL
jgi:hypothetical protein